MFNCIQVLTQKKKKTKKIAKEVQLVTIIHFKILWLNGEL